MKTKNYFRLKNLFLLSALFIFSIALALNSYAVAFECNSSSPSTIGASPINITYGGGMAAAQSNITVQIAIYSASTANSSASTFLINQSNTSNRLHINFTMASGVVLEDSNNYIIAPIAQNGSNDDNANRVTCATQTGITLDRTAPSVPTSLSPSGITTATTLNFTSTVTGTDTTGCTLSFTSSNPGQKDYAMTHSGNLCYLTISSIPKLTYIYTITASDGTNSSTSTSATVNIDGTGNQRRKAAVVGGSLGGGMSKEQIGKGLAIAQATRAGEVSQGLAKAQAQISQFVERETQGKELTKTGIGLGAGVAIGLLVPTLIIPGVGLITAPILGGLIGVGIGVAI